MTESTRGRTDPGRASTLDDRPAIWRRPIVHLLALAGGIFAVSLAATSSSDDVVRVTAEDVELVLDYQEELRGGPLGPEERQDAIDQIVEDELLIREAYRLGIDRGDPQVRQALIGAVRRDLVGAERSSVEPTAEQLVAFYQQHRSRYRVDEAITFEQVFLPFGTVTLDEEAALLRSLRETSDADAAIQAVSPAIHAVLNRRSRRVLSRGAGLEAAEAIFALPTEVWSGPIRVRQGSVLVRVLERHPARDRELDEVERYVIEDWHRDRDETIVAPRLSELRRQYRIEIDGAPR